MSAIETTAVRFGESTMLRVCQLILAVAYGGAALCGLLSPSVWVKAALVCGHLVLAGAMFTCTRAVDPADPASLTRAYMALWRLFYVEYAMLPLFGR